MRQVRRARSGPGDERRYRRPEPGSVTLAGHRETYLRGLRNVKRDDEVIVTTPSGDFRHAVEWTQVVEPQDVHVLDGGHERSLTLVTCFPFAYVGSAPLRFIVRAREVADRVR